MRKMVNLEKAFRVDSVVLFAMAPVEMISRLVADGNGQGLLPHAPRVSEVTSRVTSSAACERVARWLSASLGV